MCDKKVFDLKVSSPRQVGSQVGFPLTTQLSLFMAEEQKNVWELGNRILPSEPLTLKPK
jgi:hypothetical protein